MAPAPDIAVLPAASEGEKGDATEAPAGVPQPPAPEDGRCSFVVPGKGRRCRFMVVPGLSRCGAHREDAAAALGSRIPCPLDPGHTVYANRLDQHLKVCTKVREDSIISHQPFYRKGANAGDPATAAAAGSAATALSEEATQVWMDRIAAAFPVAVREVLGAAADPSALLELSVLESAGDVGHAEKHEVQNQALAQLVTEGGLAGQGALVVELGCGRGGLGAAVMAQRTGGRYVLVDREPRRHKFENRQESRDEQVLRLRMDVADFDLAALLGPALAPEGLPKAADFRTEALGLSAVRSNGLGPAERLEELWRAAATLQEAPWPPPQVLACAKHLCGGGTDIALRALRGCRGPASAGRPAAAVCAATCCHHRCDTSSYVNLPFLQKIGLLESDEDFAQLASRAGWAVGGMGSSKDLAKRRIGMMVKRILDLGRVAWLREDLGLRDARLVAYIGKTVTPENIAIVAGGVVSSEAHGAEGQAPG